MMAFFDGQSYWLWHDAKTVTHDAEHVGECAVFIRNFIVENVSGVQLKAAVSADAEYQLFCNGVKIGQGPVHGDGCVQYYDVYDLAPYLKAGKNELRALVVSFAGDFPDFKRGGSPMSRMCETGAFMLDATLRELCGRSEFIGTDEQWLAAEYRQSRFFPVTGVPCAGPGEKFDLALDVVTELRQAKVLDRAWTAAQVWNSLLPYRLTQAQIPPMQLSLQPFTGVFDCVGTDATAVMSMRAGKSVKVPQSGYCEFTLDWGEETTARFQLCIEGSGQIDLYYAENLDLNGLRHFQPSNPHEPVRGPMHDIISLCSASVQWQSFFLRAFRFVAVRIAAGECGVEITVNPAEKSVYPYLFTGHFVSNDATLNAMWEISRRTLALCSHDLFVDCPYYEQLQYVADTRIGALSAYAAAGDTKLARQAIEHFRRSLTPDGLTSGSYPTRSKVLLPLWSLHYIGMVYEYFFYTGNCSAVQENRTAMRRVLEWFAAAKDGEDTVGCLPYWCVADFSTDWEWHGEPPGIKTGASALPNLMYADALRQYSLMTGDDWAHEEYCIVKAATLKVFYDEKSTLFADTPNKDSFSILTNAVSILAGVGGSGGALKTALTNPAVKKAALFGNFWVFEALLQSGEVEAAESLLLEWEKLMVPGRSVWPEGTPLPRSECHVWSALPLNGLNKLYSGLTLLEPGGQRIKLTPYRGRCIELQAKIPLCSGVLELDFAPARRRVKLPFGVTAVLADKHEINGEHWQNF